jgi:hypothetical protein
VFLNETQDHEDIARIKIEDTSMLSKFLTILDMSMQQQAWQTLNIWKEASRYIDQNNWEEIRQVLQGIWASNYSHSLHTMRNATYFFKNITESKLTDQIIELMFNICAARIDAVEILGENITKMSIEFQQSKDLINTGDRKQGFNQLINTYTWSNALLHGQEYTTNGETNGEITQNILLEELYYSLILVVIFIVLFTYLRKRK